MEKNTNPTWDHFKLVLFVVFLSELVVFFMAIIFGKAIGYDLTMEACFWFGAVLAGCFALIVLGNLALIALLRVFRLVKEKSRGL